VVRVPVAPAMSMSCIPPTSRPADIEQLNPRRSIRSPRVSFALAARTRRREFKVIESSLLTAGLEAPAARHRQRWPWGSALVSLVSSLLVGLLVPTDET
jgi:hypothetical protein